MSERESMAAPPGRSRPSIRVVRPSPWVSDKIAGKCHFAKPAAHAFEEVERVYGLAVLDSLRDHGQWTAQKSCSRPVQDRGPPVLVVDNHPIEKEFLGERISEGDSHGLELVSLGGLDPGVCEDRVQDAQLA